MPSFSTQSSGRLATADPRLQALFNKVVEEWDCIILEGKRTEEQQRINVAKGVSKTMASKHVYPLEGPSLAVDAAPYPLKWPDRKSPTYVKDLCLWYAFGGYVMGVADGLGLKIRWGADWDGDQIIIDQTFDDLPHFELLL